MIIVKAEKLPSRLWVILAMNAEGQLLEFAGKTFPAAAKAMSNYLAPLQEKSA